MAEHAPSWLKAMEHGSLGEARARAFLMDRFWVLERSVDLDGADYLIQRRLLSRNFLDEQPPRLGVVQVKFIQDGSTNISLKKSYVCDSKGNANAEFFLLVFTGKEDQERSYLLSASDILGVFKERASEDESVLSLKGARLLDGSNHQILQKALALEKIDHALRTADFRRNREFLFGRFGPSVALSADQIDVDFTLPLQNPYGNIQNTFFNDKRKLQSTVREIEWALQPMYEILKMTDPVEAYAKWHDEILSQYEASGPYQKIGFAADCFDDEDFFHAAKWHKARLEKLRERRVEAAYLKLIDEFEQRVTAWLTKNRPSRSAILKIVTTYDAESLQEGQVVVTTVREIGKPISRKGRQALYFSVEEILPRRCDEETEEEVYRKMLRKFSWIYVKRFTDAVDRVYFPEEFDDD